MQFSIRNLFKLTTIVALLMLILWDADGRFTFSFWFILAIGTILAVMEFARWFSQKSKRMPEE